MTPAARLQAAIDLLAAIDDAPRRPADGVANDFFRARRFIGGGDRRAVSDRVWRVLRMRRRIDWWIARAGGAATARMRVAASLLLEGWSADGVRQSFSGGQFAPATLVAPEKVVVAALEGRTPLHPDMTLDVAVEVPEWLLPQLVARWGDETEAEMLAALEPAPLDLRVNLLAGTRDEARGRLGAEGVEAALTPLSPWGLRVDGRRAVTTGPSFQSGLVEIQDEGSQLVAALVDAGPDMRVVDFCAGAGGKTLAIAMAMRNRGHIVACDNNKRRLEGATRRLRRAGVHNVERHLLEPGDKWAKRRAGSFDRVLVDAPCSGTGTWRRNPDARGRLTAEDVRELVAKQATILDDAARLPRAGGRLVYATCSVLPEENEAQVAAFVRRRPEYAVMPLSRVWPSSLLSSPPGPGPFLSLTPRRHGTDGFFAAVLERQGAEKQDGGGEA